jgi:type II secretory pathway component PulK
MTRRMPKRRYGVVPHGALLHGTAGPGVALLTALLVVVLLTWFLSETFFATGLELRSLQAFQDSIRARTLARATLKTVLVGLLQPETDFFAVYRPAQAGLAAVPLEGGRLLELDIRPIDGLYNLNDLTNLQSASTLAVARHQVFVNLLGKIMVPGVNEQDPPVAFTAAQASALYAALIDWMDSDSQLFSIAGASGAESGDYANVEPEYVIKNARLDRLEELRLVRGFVESRLPWGEIEKSLNVRPKGAAELLPERLNVNLASKEEIIAFLEARKVEDERVLASELGTVQRAVNDYADKAGAIADALVPEAELRKTITQQTLLDALRAAGVTNANAASSVFVTFSQYYRIRITAEMSDIQARLDAQVFVRRDTNGRGVIAEVLDEVLE